MKLKTGNDENDKPIKNIVDLRVGTVASHTTKDGKQSMILGGTIKAVDGESAYVALQLDEESWNRVREHVRLFNEAEAKQKGRTAVKP